MPIKNTVLEKPTSPSSYDEADVLSLDNFEKNSTAPATGEMLISRSRNKFAKINCGKVARGQFNTVGATWLQPQVLDFIKSSGAKKCLDPFAGRGDILHTVAEQVGLDTVGLDVDASLGWEGNDSLKSIPYDYSDCIIVTNPPYLAKYSATRKRVASEVTAYYSRWEDLYMQALDVCLDTCKYVVAIVPETFLNSTYPKHNCHSISIITENPFTDTDCPVCVVCMTRQIRESQDIAVYIDSEHIASWHDLRSQAIEPTGIVEMKFNDPAGAIGLQAVDLTGVNDKIRFTTARDLDYDRSNIKVSSRLITFLSIDGLDETKIPRFVAEANALLGHWRVQTRDILLSPFKGNAKDGLRRRRLDYRTARGIIEQAYEKIQGNNQILLFK